MCTYRVKIVRSGEWPEFLYIWWQMVWKIRNHMESGIYCTAVELMWFVSDGHSGFESEGGLKAPWREGPCVSSEVWGVQKIQSGRSNREIYAFKPHVSLKSWVLYRWYISSKSLSSILCFHHSAIRRNKNVYYKTPIENATSGGQGNGSEWLMQWSSKNSNPTNRPESDLWFHLYKLHISLDVSNPKSDAPKQ